MPTSVSCAEVSYCFSVVRQSGLCALQLDARAFHGRAERQHLVLNEPGKRRRAGRAGGDAQVKHFFLISALCKISLQAALSLVTTSGGMLAGPFRPKKLLSTSLRQLNSTTLGTTGTSGERMLEVTATGTSCPLLK